MLKIAHTEWPVGRRPIATNTVKNGGICHSESKKELLNTADNLVRKQARKDEVKEFAKIFWLVVGLLIALIVMVKEFN